MNKIPIFCLLGVAFSFLSLVGCKIEITVPEGGRVNSSSGAYACSSDSACTIDVYDVYFDEYFISVPDAGHVLAISDV